MKTMQKLSVTAAVASLVVAGVLAANPTPAHAAGGPTAINAKNFWVTANYGAPYSDPVAGLLSQAGHASVDTVMDHANHDRTPATAISSQVHGFQWDSVRRERRQRRAAGHHHQPGRGRDGRQRAV